MKLTAFGASFAPGQLNGAPIWNVEHLSNGQTAIYASDGRFAQLSGYGEVLKTAAIGSGNLSSGRLDALADGRFVITGVQHAGLGIGTLGQVFESDGRGVSDIINLGVRPEGDSTSGGVVTGLAAGGFFFATTDTFRSGQSAELTYPKDINDHDNNTVGLGQDVTTRWFDASYAGGGFGGTSSGPRTLAGATISDARGGSQTVADAVQLGSSNVATAYVDQWFWGGTSPAGGYFANYSLMVQIAGPDGALTEFKVNTDTPNTSKAAYDNDPIDPGSVAPQVTRLDSGGFVVTWNEVVRSSSGAFTGWSTKARYFNDDGSARTGEIALYSRPADHGNLSKANVVEALPDGRLLVGHSQGVYIPNGASYSVAYLSVVGQLGSSVETFAISDKTPEESQAGTIYDIAANEDGTISIAWGEEGYASGIAPAHVQRYVLGGNGASVLNGNADANNLTGTSGGDWLHGQDGADTLSGGGGKDHVYGGAGDDLLTGGAGADTLAGGEGVDTASYSASTASITVSLAKTGKDTGAGVDTLASIENLIGSAVGDDLSGDGGANQLWGGGGGDRIYGADGDDLLSGEAGGDTLLGAGGKDQLVGGAGSDRLTGGSDKDVFVFDVVEANSDTIMDLEKGDRIDLSAMDANSKADGDQAFKLVDAFTGKAGQAVLDFHSDAGETVLMLDFNGDGEADMTIHLAGRDFEHFGGFVL